jgi:hypothetical protein
VRIAVDDQDRSELSRPPQSIQHGVSAAGAEFAPTGKTEVLLVHTVGAAGRDHGRPRRQSDQGREGGAKDAKIRSRVLPSLERP